MSNTDSQWRQLHRQWTRLQERPHSTHSLELARSISSAYSSFTDSDKRLALLAVTEKFGVSFKEVSDRVAAYSLAHTKDDPVQELKATAILREAVTPSYASVLQVLTHQPHGVKFVVNLRADVLKFARSIQTELRQYAGESSSRKSEAHVRLAQEHSRLQALADELRRLFLLWFGVGFLELQNITWEHSASLLEFIANHEAVHKLRSIEDLKTRLGSGRRFFAFFHPSMPAEPLIFVEVALVDELASSIQAILGGQGSEQPEREATTAIFYSICTTQPGLAGIDLGEQLIRRVVQQLNVELPNLKVFSTLSPIILFRSWLTSKVAREREGKSIASNGLLRPRELDALASIGTAGESGYDVLFRLITSFEAERSSSLLEHRTILQPIFERLCAFYLLEEKRRRRALDPVCNFHVSNGARVQQINYIGDTSKKGLEQSCGLMVNYLYDVQRLDERSEQYSAEFFVSRSAEVERLLDRIDGGVSKL